MGLRDQVISHVTEEAYDELVLLVKENKRAVKYLYALIYEPDSEIKWKTVRAYGYLTKMLADEDTEFYRDVIRRFVWMMNEEGGNSNWSAPEVIGEMIYEKPNLFGNFATIMITAAHEEKIFQRGMFQAIIRFGHKVPNEVKKYEKELLRFITSQDKELQALSIKAAGAARLQGAVPILQNMVMDETPLALRVAGKTEETTLGNLIREAMAQITTSG